MARKTFGARPNRSSSSLLWRWLALALVVILADQFTKMLIVGRFAYGDSIEITPWFNLVRAHNTGAAFSFLAQAAGWQRWFFIGLGTLASLFFVWLLRAHAQQTLFAFSIAMLLGGSVGNVVDRIWHGYVVDFLQVHWGVLSVLFPSGYFPAFNLADSAITAGAIGLILDELRRVRRG